jgi:hypothetical protein
MPTFTYTPADEADRRMSNKVRGNTFDPGPNTPEGKRLRGLTGPALAAEVLAMQKPKARKAAPKVAPKGKAKPKARKAPAKKAPARKVTTRTQLTELSEFQRRVKADPATYGPFMFGRAILKDGTVRYTLTSDQWAARQALAAEVA